MTRLTMARCQLWELTTSCRLSELTRQLWELAMARCQLLWELTRCQLWESTRCWLWELTRCQLRDLTQKTSTRRPSLIY
jgi:hypothetical protein